jgi:hypothetical protein
MTKVPKRVVEAARRLKDGKPSRRYTVRALLKWFKVSRRGIKVVSDIREALESVGLGCAT